MFLKTELKKNKRDIKTLENLIDETKRDLLKIFTEPDSDVVVDDIININDWENKTKNKLDILPVEWLKQIMQIYCNEWSLIMKIKNCCFHNY